MIVIDRLSTVSTSANQARVLTEHCGLTNNVRGLRRVAAIVSMKTARELSIDTCALWDAVHTRYYQAMNGLVDERVGRSDQQAALRHPLTQSEADAALEMWGRPARASLESFAQLLTGVLYLIDIEHGRDPRDVIPALEIYQVAPHA